MRTGERLAWFQTLKQCGHASPVPSSTPRTGRRVSPHSRPGHRPRRTDGRPWPRALPRTLSQKTGARLSRRRGHRRALRCGDEALKPAPRPARPRPGANPRTMKERAGKRDGVAIYRNSSGSYFSFHDRVKALRGARFPGRASWRSGSVSSHARSGRRKPPTLVVAVASRPRRLALRWSGSLQRGSRRRRREAVEDLLAKGVGESDAPPRPHLSRRTARTSRRRVDDYFGTMLVKEAGPSSGRAHQRLGGKVMGDERLHRVPDGKTLTLKWSDMSGTEPVTGESMSSGKARPQGGETPSPGPGTERVPVRVGERPDGDAESIRRRAEHELANRSELHREVRRQGRPDSTATRGEPPPR